MEKNHPNIPVSKKQRHLQRLQTQFSNTDLYITTRRSGQNSTAPNPLLLDTNSVELRRYHERDIVKNRYKSLEWAAVALLLVADMIGSANTYATRQSTALRYNKLAIDVSKLAQAEASGPEQPDPKQSDYKLHSTSIERQVRKVLEEFFKDEGLISRNGKRPIYNNADFDRELEYIEYAIDLENEDGLIDIPPNKKKKEVSKRMVETTGLAENTVRKRINERDDRYNEQKAIDDKIEETNKGIDSD